MKRIYRILLLSFLFIALIVQPQTKEGLKKQKEKLEEEILYNEKLLSKTKSTKDQSLNYLSVLEAQITKKEKLLSTLNLEIRLLEKQIKRTEIRISETKKLILKESQKQEKLKAQYAQMIYSLYKQKDARNNLMFIISSSDFNQAYKRFLYLKQYSQFRKNQYSKIEQSQQKLSKTKEKLLDQKNDLLHESTIKKNLIKSKQVELISVNNSHNEKQELVKKLTKSEKLFKRKIQEKRQKTKDLDAKIKKIIEEEIRKARRASKGQNKGYTLTPEAIALSKGFASNKGKLPWPLEKGVIVSRYGKQRHPVFSGIETFNNGIDIATEKNTAIRVVFDGVVSRIFFIKGEGKAVLINHGDYFTVYSGLSVVNVKNGEKLLSKEKIGIVSTQEQEEKTQLHFEIWKGYEKEDPSKWLYKAY